MLFCYESTGCERCYEQTATTRVYRLFYISLLALAKLSQQAPTMTSYAFVAHGAIWWPPYSVHIQAVLSHDQGRHGTLRYDMTHDKAGDEATTYKLARKPAASRML